MAYLMFQPYRPHDLFDRTMTDYVDWVANGWYYHAMRTGELVYPFTDVRYCPQVKGRADFWAVNMYARDLVDSRRQDGRAGRYHHRALRISKAKAYVEKPWEFSPDELMANLFRLKDKPVYITENGCITDDDRFRIAYIALHLAAFRQAIDLGVDLRSYFHWSLMDNYEWGDYDPKLGLVAFDPKTFERHPKPSAWFFKDVIEANAISGELVRKYLKHLHPWRMDERSPLEWSSATLACRRGQAARIPATAERRAWGSSFLTYFVTPDSGDANLLWSASPLLPSSYRTTGMSFVFGISFNMRATASPFRLLKTRFTRITSGLCTIAFSNICGPMPTHSTV